MAVTPTRNITKYEMLLAIAMSEFHETTHVLFIPPDTNYRHMLKVLENSKHIQPLGKSYWVLSKKGWKWLKNNKKDQFTQKDAEIDAFIDNL
jgi:hypothetical protein